MVDTEQSYQGKHILAMFSNRQNGSECPKSVPCDVTPVTQRALKIDKKCFLGKSTINRKNQNFATKRFVRTPIHVFLPSFVEIRKTEVIKLSLSPEPPKRFRLKFYRVTSFHSPCLPSFVQIHLISGKIYGKMSFRVIKTLA